MSPQKRLQKNAARRERNRQIFYAERVLKPRNFSRSDRSNAKELACQAALDQVALDKEQGKELGWLCRKLYRERGRPVPTPSRGKRRTSGPRPAETYRGMRYNLLDKRDRASRQVKKLLRKAEQMRQSVDNLTTVERAA